MTKIKPITTLAFALIGATSTLFSQIKKDTNYFEFSFSVLPKISIKRTLSNYTVNKYSLNLFAGNSNGVNAFEFGGFVNIVNGNVKYCQIAGLTNVVSGNVTGVQLSGLLNVNSKQTKGLQIAGVTNINQEHVKGFQLSGIYNQTKNIKGVQLSGILNIADSVKGLQISGILNKAKHLKGVQLSFLNVLDTVSGLPIGFFSYVKKGYHKIEIATDELKFGTISFGTGINQFHNIFIVGVNYSNTKLWTYGYGLGGVFPIHKKWSIAINATAQQFQHTDYTISTNNIMSKLFVGIEYKIKPKIHIGLGPTFNHFTTKTTDASYNEVFNKLSSSYIYNESIGNRNTKMWVGAKLYLKLL